MHGSDLPRPSHLRRRRVWIGLALLTAAATGAAQAATAVGVGTGPSGGAGALAADGVAAPVLPAARPGFPLFLPHSDALPDRSTSQEASGAITVLNDLRSTFGVGAVSLSGSMSANAASHANYMAVNNVVAHGENPTLPGYTTGGNAAGLCGNEAEDGYHFRGLTDAIYSWAQAPFHEMGELSPSWTSVGIARQSTSGSTDSPGEDFSSLTCASSGGTLSNTVPSVSAHYPLTLPADHGTLPWTTWSQDEVPSPNPTCSSQGLSHVTGANLLATFGATHAPITSASSTLTDAAGGTVPVCVITETNVVADNSGLKAAPDLLKNHSVVVIARNPLQPRHTYSWSLTVNGSTVHRTFTVARRDLAVTPGGPLTCANGVCAVYGLARSMNDLSPAASAGPLTLRLVVAHDGGDPLTSGAAEDTEAAQVLPGYSGSSLAFAAGDQGRVRFAIVTDGNDDDDEIWAESCTVTLVSSGYPVAACAKPIRIKGGGQTAQARATSPSSRTSPTVAHLPSGCTVSPGSAAPGTTLLWKCRLPKATPGTQATVEVQQGRRWRARAHPKVGPKRYVTWTTTSPRSHVRLLWRHGSKLERTRVC